MKARSRLLLACMLAIVLPMQSFGATLAHCRPNAGAASNAIMARLEAPCAHHAMGATGDKSHEAPSTQHAGGHGAACAACCGAPAPQAELASAARAEATSFPRVDERFAQFIPAGLKRPPSEL